METGKTETITAETGNIPKTEIKEYQTEKFKRIKEKYSVKVPVFETPKWMDNYWEW